jgi:hypothetical protein
MTVPFLLWGPTKGESARRCRDLQSELYPDGSASVQISDSIFKQQPSTHSVIAGHSCPKDGVASARLCRQSIFFENDHAKIDGCPDQALALTSVFASTSRFQTCVRALAARCARGVDESSAQGGRGECRVPAAPAASCALCSGRSARVTTSTPESPGIPARNGFNGVCRALPGDRALLPPSSCEYGMSAPGRADMPPQNLTPASGRQNHTIWPSAGNISRPRA